MNLMGKRFYDRVMASDWLIPLYTVAPEYKDRVNPKTMAQGIQVMLRGAQVFEITSTAEYYFQGNDKEEWDLYTDFPLMSPPFPNMWFEYKIPEFARSNGKIITADEQLKGAMVGVSIRSTTLAEFGVKHLEREAERQLAVAGLKGADVRFMSLKVFTRRGDYIRGPGMTAAWIVDSKGNPLSLNGDRKGIQFLSEGGVHTPHIEEEQQQIFTLSHPALLAISFLNCKNTTVTTHTPDEKLSNAHRREHGKRLTSFKTIEVSQVSRVMKEAMGTSSKDLKSALHMRRGHFKNFDEKPLFGKHKGMYWWGPAICGTGPHAAIKEYEMK